MPKSKHRRKGKNRARPASLSGTTSDDPELAALLADAETDGAFDDPADDPEMAKALARAEAELADELDAAGEDGDLGPFLDGSESDEEFDRVAQSLTEAVEAQLSANDPPEVAATLARLLAAGHDRARAIAMIGMVMMIEMNEILRNERPFDRARYAGHLAALPELPAFD